MNHSERSAVVLLVALGLAAVRVPAFAQGALPGVPHRAMPDNSPTLGAHARYSKAPINMNAPNLTLTADVVGAGGGASAFDANTLVAKLTGNGPVTQTELAALTKKFGANNVTSFAKTFDFVIADALGHVSRNGTALPAMPAAGATDGRALSAGLYTAGVMANGKFDAEYMLDTLVSHIVHVQVMNDIDANPDLGPTADANYHLVLAQVMLDLKKTYDL